jgi:CxxC motif-containing protein (DUF1111 family)
MKSIIYLSAFVSAFSFAELPLTGGTTTTKQAGTAAFSQPAANMSLLDKVDFSVGNSFFRNPWVIAPSSTTARDGLGPLFNTNGCQNCHIRDGRGHAPINAEDSAVSMLVRLSLTPQNDEQAHQQRLNGPIGEPNYGGQLQDFGIPGVTAEGTISVDWNENTFHYPDGQKVVLRSPTFNIMNKAYGEFHEHTQFSPRIAPQMIGLGLLEHISEQDILANADVNDSNNDGISGKANQVWNVREQKTTLGRFGWKAGMPTLEQQNAGAFNGDLGITSELFPQDHCTDSQVDCKNAPNGDTGEEKELQKDILAAVTFYSQHLAVPIQRNPTNIDVIRGQTLFDDVGCAACHVSTFTTPLNIELPALSQQTFHPFTDLLLHDMGEDLADNADEFLANGREWRTPPLWGLGYLQEVNEQIALLHDGRAQSVEEAILWHGGEGEASKEAFTQLPKPERDALIAFLNSL